MITKVDCEKIVAENVHKETYINYRGITMNKREFKVGDLVYEHRGNGKFGITKLQAVEVDTNVFILVGMDESYTDEGFGRKGNIIYPVNEDSYEALVKLVGKENVESLYYSRYKNISDLLNRQVFVPCKVSNVIEKNPSNFESYKNIVSVNGEKSSYPYEEDDGTCWKYAIPVNLNGKEIINLKNYKK